MADSSFETEVQALQKFLSMQKTTPSPEKVVVTPNQLDIQPEDFVSPRYYKKIKAKQVNWIVSVSGICCIVKKRNC